MKTYKMPKTKVDKIARIITEKHTTLRYEGYTESEIMTYMSNYLTDLLTFENLKYDEKNYVSNSLEYYNLNKE